MHRLYRLAKPLVPLWMAVLLVSCVGSEGTATTVAAAGPITTAAVPGAPTAEPEAQDEVGRVAALLADPDKAKEGIRELLGQIGVGIYTADGMPIAPGSERDEDDFIVYDFQLPALAVLHRGRQWTFADLAERFAAVGIEVGAEELRETYQAAYSGRKEFLPRFLTESGLDLSVADASFTPLHAWLMILDGLVPPNDASSAGHSRQVNLAQAGCSLSGPLQSGWGFVAGAAADWTELIIAEQAFRLMNAMTLAESMLIEGTANPPVVHEGHGSEGDTVTFGAALVAHWQPTPIPVTCGYLTAWPIIGQLPSTVLNWDLPAGASRHGEFFVAGVPVGQQHITSSPGEIQFVAREEPETTTEHLWVENFEVTIEADPLQGLLAAGVDPATVELMRPVTGTIEFVVEFHREIWELYMVDDSPGELGSVERKWIGLFQVEGERITGAGEVDVRGEVVCIDTETAVPFSGTIPFTISGRASRDAFQISLDHGTPDVGYTEPIPGLCADPDSLAFIDEFNIEQLAYEDLEAFEFFYGESLEVPREDGAGASFTNTFGFGELNVEVTTVAPENG